MQLDDCSPKMKKAEVGVLTTVAKEQRCFEHLKCKVSIRKKGAKGIDVISLYCYMPHHDVLISIYI